MRENMLLHLEQNAKRYPQNPDRPEARKHLATVNFYIKQDLTLSLDRLFRRYTLLHLEGKTFKRSVIHIFSSTVICTL